MSEKRLTATQEEFVATMMRKIKERKARKVKMQNDINAMASNNRFNIAKRRGFKK